MAIKPSTGGAHVSPTVPAKAEPKGKGQNSGKLSHARMTTLPKIETTKGF